MSTYTDNTIIPAVRKWFSWSVTSSTHSTACVIPRDVQGRAPHAEQGSTAEEEVISISLHGLLVMAVLRWDRASFSPEHIRAAPEVMPPISHCRPTKSEMDGGGTAVEDEPSHQYSTLSPCDGWQQRGSPAEWRLTWKRVRSKGVELNPSTWKKNNETHWHSFTSTAYRHSFITSKNVELTVATAVL